MKKILCALLAALLLVSAACAAPAPEQELRGVWFSCYEYGTFFQNLDKAAFTAQADTICKNVKGAGFNAIFYHVRAFSDAFYPSDLFGWSKYVTGAAGVGPDYDPLAIFIDSAHRQGLQVHAWFNPYRIGNESNVTQDCRAMQWRNDNSGRVLEWNGALYYNPANADVQAYILEGVAEVLERYDVDGVQYDDYFYPTSDPAFDSAYYTGAPERLNECRRENVSNLIKSTYQLVKEKNQALLFGVSPNADIPKNYNQLYADVETWGGTSEYVDYLAPQIYYGYENSALPYSEVLAQWQSICKLPDLVVGLAAYKTGNEDQWAGDGKAEWLEHSDILSRQYQDAQKAEKFGGIIAFSYSSLFAPDEAVSATANAERQALSAAFGAPQKETSPTLLQSFLWLLQSLFPF